MEDKEAIKILIRLMKKASLSVEEKEALSAAIGILSWSALGQARIKNMGKTHRAKREKETRVNNLLNQ
ncbi:hypothetical protein EPO05_05865 [Patescibacteria group bacterium]|nr:MAG: hypothetical protein EPO05_05865 [Patescibacteria group bacterium]